MGWSDRTVQRLDATLAALARDETALRLRLGQALEVLGRGGVFDLGFSSLTGYAAERCERSVRWAEGARCLARRVEKLPELRRAMATGAVSWTMGELLARVALPADELHWLEAARTRTVRQMRGLVANAASPGSGAHVVDTNAPDADESEDDDSDTCTLTCTVDREEAWLFEATRSLLELLGVNGGDAQLEALLAEAQGTLLAAIPPADFELDGLQSCEAARQQQLAELRRWRAEVETCCETSILRSVLEGRARAATAGRVAIAAALGMESLERVSSAEVDRHVRALHTAMARHELELSELVLRFHRAQGWRQLGYASETHYARERLGISASSLLARRSLALRLEKLPAIANALGTGKIGVEAAVQLVRVATARTEAAWVMRARQRTIKHLKEEVAAALVAVRWSGELDCLPPLDAELTSFHALEQAVVSGRIDPSHVGKRPKPVSCRREPESQERRAWFVMLASLASWLDGGLQMSAGPSGPRPRVACRAGRVTLRLRMSRATRAWWYALEAQARRWLPRGISWLRFSCTAVWRAWKHLLGAKAAYGHIYGRDRYRCTSPVCNRRDVTPHHLRFRSAGGSDEAHNVTTVCTWCHLFGVHGGRIRASGTAELIHWELGAMSPPCLVVHGRERELFD